MISSLFKKVITALKLGLRLDDKSINAIEHVLKTREKLNIVASRALVTTLSLHAKGKKDFNSNVAILELIFSRWMKRISEGKEKFYTEREKVKVEEILRRMGFRNSKKVVSSIISSFSYDSGELYNREFSHIRKKVDKEILSFEKEEKKDVKEDIKKDKESIKERKRDEKVGLYT